MDEPSPVRFGPVGAGEPGWVKPIDSGLADLAAGRGLAVSILL